MELSEQELIRRKSLEELISRGINPYPADTYEVNTNCGEILANFSKDNSQFQDISLAGRIMSRRIMGATAASRSMSGVMTFAREKTRRCITRCSNGYWI